MIQFNCRWPRIALQPNLIESLRIRARTTPITHQRFFTSFILQSQTMFGKFRQTISVKPDRRKMHSTLGTDCTAEPFVVEAKDADAAAGTGIIKFRTGNGALLLQLATTGAAPERFKLRRLLAE